MHPILTSLALAMCSITPIHAASEADCSFNGPITQSALENILARSVQFLGLCCDNDSQPAPYFEDNLRLIKNLKPRFIGRAAYAWGCPSDDEVHYRVSAENAARVHAIDPTIVLQACVFETAYSAKCPEVQDRVHAGQFIPGVELIPIPAWVFEEFGLEPEPRTFNYEAMLYTDGRMRNLWQPGASVPDITQLETRLWFYYRARRYIDAGYEAIHFGQVQLIGQADTGWRYWREVVQRVRSYAADHARRKWVLCDGHFGLNRPDPGVAVDGKLIWDFIGFPLRPVDVPDDPLQCALRMGHLDTNYGRAPSGIHPGGWQCNCIPQLYEFDNCSAGITGEQDWLPWGADESTWFANLPEIQRNSFLEYAQNWIWNHCAHGYLQMPGRRPAVTPILGYKSWMYVCNTRSEACPEGAGQEETMKTIWAAPGYQDALTRQITPPPAELPVKPVNKLPDMPALSQVNEYLQKWNLPGRVAFRTTKEYLTNLFYLFGEGYSDEEKDIARDGLIEYCAESVPQMTTIDGREAMQFGKNAWLDFASDAPLRSSQFTVSLWFWIDEFSESFNLVDKEDWLKSGFYIKYHPSTPEFYAEAFDGTGNRTDIRFNDITEKTWVHLAMVADGENLKIYMGGEKVGEKPCGPVVENGLPLLVGKNCPGVAISDFRFTPHALTEDEIAKLANTN